VNFGSFWRLISSTILYNFFICTVQ
jgi:hypothetical protein